MDRRVRGFGIAVLTVVLCSACAESDAGITTKVKARLDAQRDLTSTSIQVQTTHHVVTLSGSAASDTEKQKAIQIAKGTEGVKEVVDQLSVVPPSAPAAAAPVSSPAASTGETTAPTPSQPSEVSPAPPAR